MDHVHVGPRSRNLPVLALGANAPSQSLLLGDRSIAAAPATTSSSRLFAVPPPSTPNVLGALAFLLAVSSLPMFRGPRWLKQGFARIVRSTKPVPAFHWTRLGDTQLVLGTVPTSDENLAELHAAGVRAVLTLNQRWEPQAPGGVGAACRRTGLGLAHLSLPTPDYSAPSQRDIRAAVAFIEAQVADGGSVYVHCNAGRGRSAVCVLAYLMHARGLSALEAYEFVASHRRITRMPSRLCFLPRPQWQALLRFERALAAKRRAQERRQRAGERNESKGAGR
jgi:atypical dual specificity phosphatase